MDTGKKIKILISTMIIFFPTILTGTFWGFPQTPNWGTLMMFAFYSSEIICGSLGLYLIYKTFD